MTKAERTRKFIIEVAAPIFNKKGMAGTSLSDIMEATQLAKGGIYGNFENKDEICIEAFAYLSEILNDRLNNAIFKGNTAQEKLFNLLDTYQNKSNDGGCPLLNFGVDADDTHPVIKEKVKKAILNSQERIFSIINDGIENKEISENLDPKIFSIKVFAMIEGAILCRRVSDNDNQMKVILDAIKNEFKMYLL